MKFCVCLPSGNANEFADIEAQFQKRGIIYAKKLKFGGAIFEFDGSQVGKLPVDNFGHFVPVNDISGYSFFETNSVEDCLYQALMKLESRIN